LGTAVRSIAEQRLRDQKSLHRGTAKSAGNKRILTFSDALADCRHLVDTAVNNKDSSKDYPEQTIEALLRSWPGLPETDTRKITEHDCREWGKSFALQSQREPIQPHGRNTARRSPDRGGSRVISLGILDWRCPRCGSLISRSSSRHQTNSKSSLQDPNGRRPLLRRCRRFHGVPRIHRLPQRRSRSYHVGPREFPQKRAPNPWRPGDRYKKLELSDQSDGRAAARNAISPTRRRRTTSAICSATWSIGRGRSPRPLNAQAAADWNGFACARRNEIDLL
jgi:hypothetical protein